MVFSLAFLCFMCGSEVSSIQMRESGKEYSDFYSEINIAAQAEWKCCLVKYLQIPFTCFFLKSGVWIWNLNISIKNALIILSGLFLAA